MFEIKSSGPKQRFNSLLNELEYYAMYQIVDHNIHYSYCECPIIFSASKLVALASEQIESLLLLCVRVCASIAWTEGKAIIVAASNKCGFAFKSRTFSSIDQQQIDGWFIHSANELHCKSKKVLKNQRYSANFRSKWTCSQTVCLYWCFAFISLMIGPIWKPFVCTLTLNRF